MSSDYFMRQIEGISDVLSVLLFDKKASGNTDTVYDVQTSMEGHSLLIDLRFLTSTGQVNEAENLLFERMQADDDASGQEVARQFYTWLDRLSDDQLEKSNFSRGEINEGRLAAEKFYRERMRRFDHK